MEELLPRQDEAVRRFLRHLSAEGVALGALPGPLHIELTAGQSRRYALWVRAGDPGALQSEIRRVAEGLPPFDRLDLEIPRKRRTLDQATFERLGRVQLGLASLYLFFNGTHERHAAKRMLTLNTSFQKTLESFCERRKIDTKLFWAGGGTAQLTIMETWRLHVGPPVRVLPLYRSGTLVTAAEVTPDFVQTLARDLAGWLVRNTAADGTTPYKLWPSRGEEAKSDNSLRRFMATLWMNRWAHHSGEAEDRAAADRNLRRNLRVHMIEDEGRAYIDDGGKTKLGGTAFAATAVRESPLRAELADTLSKLDAGIQFLWNEDGSFRTFHRPADRNDNQNFYPGEALVYLGSVARETGDMALRQRIEQSIAWYRQWHYENRNPAFVPWHTQAATTALELGGAPWLQDWIFEMNDWLLSMQQVATAPYPDLIGRFYDPERPGYGVPHASSTGVYLEGLADAFKLADAAGDSTRRERYGTAIKLGLRDIRQLQFRVEEVMPYRNPERLLGGVRTEVYDNGLRVDNVQHALGACLKLMAQPRFAAWLSAPPAAEG